MKTFVINENTVQWPDIREQVRTINPELATLIDALSPNYPLKLKKAEYGAILASSQHKPNPWLVLDKTCELYFKYNNRIMPYHVYKPGDFLFTDNLFGLPALFYRYHLWRCSAGCRSVFMLPGISDFKQHLHLLDHYRIDVAKPLGLHDHWQTFRAIAASPIHQDPWQASILEFTDAWFQHQNDPAWQEFYNLLKDSAWQQAKIQRDKPLIEMLFGLFQRERRYKVSMHHAEQVSHLYMIGLGGMPGFRAATEMMMPVRLIQQAYQLIYKLKDYAPVIMGPDYFDFHAGSQSIYYSLNYQTSYLLSPPENEYKTLAKNMQQIHWLFYKMRDFIFNKPFIEEESALHDLLRECQLYFYHYEAKTYREFTGLEEIGKHNPSLIADWPDLQLHSLNSFLNGCIEITKTNEQK